MSRIVFLILSLLATVMIITLSANPVLATSACPGPTAQTDPTPLLNNHRTAKFTIDVGNNTNYPNFQMQFKCGIRPEGNVENAIKDSKNQKLIFVDLDRQAPGFAPPCEFTLGTHEIIVTATTTSSSRVDQCVATYTVIDADTLCQLTIHDSDNPTLLEQDIKITSNSNLTVSGTNLNKDHDFRVFVDKKGISRFVNKPSFDNVKIEQKFLTLGQHYISLRLCGTSDSDDCGPALCPRVFRVGTPDNPGNVSHPGTEIPKGCTEDDIKHGKCTSGGGEKAPGCTDDKDHPAIETAIGCVHTNPAEFVKDFMKWVLGIGGGLAFLMMLLGAFQMLTSAGNPETLNAGRERLTSAVIGLLFIIFTILLLQIIGVGILNIPGFK